MYSDIIYSKLDIEDYQCHFPNDIQKFRIVVASFFHIPATFCNHIQTFVPFVSQSRVSKFFCQRATCGVAQQFREPDILRIVFDSAYATFYEINKLFVNISIIIFFIVKEMTTRAGFGPQAVVWRPLSQRIQVIFDKITNF